MLRVYICLSYHVGYSNYQGWRLLKFGQDETTTTSDTSTLLCTPQLHPVPRFQRSYGSFTVPWYLFTKKKRGGHSLACPGPMADVGEGDQTGTRAPNLLVSCASCPTDGLHRSRSPTKHGIGKTPCVMRGRCVKRIRCVNVNVCGTAAMPAYAIQPNCMYIMCGNQVHDLIVKYIWMDGDEHLAHVHVMCVCM